MKKTMLIALVLLTSAATFAQTNKAGKIYLQHMKNNFNKGIFLWSK